MASNSPGLKTGKGTMDFYVTQNLSHHLRIEIRGSFNLKYIIDCLEKARFFHTGGLSQEEALEHIYNNPKASGIDKDSIPYIPLFELHKVNLFGDGLYSRFLTKLFRRYMDFTERDKDPESLTPSGHALVRIIREDKNLLGEIESRDLVDLVLVRRKRAHESFDDIRKAVKRRFKNYISDKGIDQIISLVDKGLFHKINAQKESPPINFNEIDRKRFRKKVGHWFRTGGKYDLD